MNWLDLFCKNLSCSSSFRNQIDLQLSRQFHEKTGIRLEGFVLVPPPQGAAEIDFDASGVARLQTDLVAEDATGYPVTIAWRSSDGRRVLPAGVSHQDGPIDVEAWWHELPAEELKGLSDTAETAPWPISPEFPFEPNRYSFEIAWRRFAWPDLWLEVKTSKKNSPASIDGLVAALEEARDRWNQRSRSEAGVGTIHNVGTQRTLVGDKAFALNLDFGSAQPGALLTMFEAIEAVAAALKIDRVVCRAAPSRDSGEGGA